jgi:hypothetical protein
MCSLDCSRMFSKFEEVLIVHMKVQLVIMHFVLFGALPLHLFKHATGTNNDVF